MSPLSRQLVCQLRLQLLTAAHGATSPSLSLSLSLSLQFKSFLENVKQGPRIQMDSVKEASWSTQKAGQEA